MVIVFFNDATNFNMLLVLVIFLISLLKSAVVSVVDFSVVNVFWQFLFPPIYHFRYFLLSMCYNFSDVSDFYVLTYSVVTLIYLLACFIFLVLLILKSSSVVFIALFGVSYFYVFLFIHSLVSNFCFCWCVMLYPILLLSPLVLICPFSGLSIFFFLLFAYIADKILCCCCGIFFCLMISPFYLFFCFCQCVIIFCRICFIHCSWFPFFWFLYLPISFFSAVAVSDFSVFFVFFFMFIQINLFLFLYTFNVLWFIWCHWFLCLYWFCCNTDSLFSWFRFFSDVSAKICCL